MSLPKDAQKIEVAGSTVDFYTYMEDNNTIYQFDTSKTGPPEPMVNAMVGLKLVDSSDKKLVMINHKAPGGLFAKVNENYTHVVQDLEDGNVKVVFSFIDGAAPKTDFSNNTCG